jgi:hypothetical protein
MTVIRGTGSGQGFGTATNQPSRGHHAPTGWTTVTGTGTVQGGGQTTPVRGQGTGSGAGSGFQRYDQAFRPSDPTMVAIRTESWLDPKKHSGLVVARLANPSPQIVAGGGWEDVQRPLRRGMPEWRGTASPTLTLSLILEGGDLGANVSIEPVCEEIEHMAGGLIGDVEPPKLVLYGKMIPREAKFSTRRWVIAEPPSWDTSPDGVIRHPTGGYRLRQVVDLTFILLAGQTALRHLGGGGPKPRYRYIKAHHNDTFEKIAKRELGTKRLAHKLAQLNGRGGGAVSVKLKKGTRIKLPTGSLLAEWRRDLGKK